MAVFVIERRVVKTRVCSDGNGENTGLFVEANN